MKSSAFDSHPDFAFMDRQLLDVTVEMFAAYGVPIELCPTMTESGLGRETYCMASIGYVGRALKGVLILVATRAAAEAWTNAAGGVEFDLVDTVGEFSNMLLGRLKGRLLRAGIPISLATPMTVVGDGLRVSEAPGTSRWHFFEGPGWHLATRLDATFQPGFQREATAAQPAEAGDAILF